MRNKSELVLDGIIHLILVIGCLFFEAFVGMKLFNWFLAPITNFEIGYWHAMGLGVVISFIFTSIKLAINNLEKHEKSEIVFNWGVPIGVIIAYAILLGLGALIVLGI